MMYYPMNIAGLSRKLPLCPISDQVCIAAFVIFGDVELTEATARELLKKAPPHDFLLSAEAKGIPLVQEMARQNGEPRYFLARKAPKLYMPNPLVVDVQSITTAKAQKLYLGAQDAKLMQGKQILIVDDVISTGESLRALETLVQLAGGKVAGRMAILAEGEAQNRTDIVYLEKLPLFRPDGTPIPM